MFRIAQEDYARLLTIVSTSGARSFSDFARSQVLRVLGEPSLADVGQRLSELELTIQQLTETLQRTKHGDVVVQNVDGSFSHLPLHRTEG